jgi:hypothetical protein
MQGEGETAGAAAAPAGMVSPAGFKNATTEEVLFLLLVLFELVFDLSMEKVQNITMRVFRAVFGAGGTDLRT